MLAFSLRHRAWVLGLALLAFLGGLGITNFLGKEFIPPEDQGRFIIRMQVPVDYSVDEADRMFRRAEEILRKFPEVTSIYYALGTGTTEEINKAVLFNTLKPKAERKKNQEQIKKEVRRELAAIIGLKFSVEDVALIGGGQRMVPIQYSIRGRNLKELETYSREVTNQFSRLPGIVDVDTSLESGKPENRILIDRNKAADLGVDIGSVAEVINILIGGEVDVTKFKDETRGRRYDVRARLWAEGRTNPEDIGRLYVRSKDGRLVELGNIVKIQEGGGPSIINRVDRQRAITLFANLEGKTLGQAKGELDAIARKVLPFEYSGTYKGMADTMGESFEFLMFALLLGVVMAYMVLAAQFESFVQPIIILLSLPFSFIGAFGALLLTGRTLNIFSFIGLILLMGLVKKNAHPACGLHEYAPAEGACEKGGDSGSGAREIAADSDDHFRHDLRDAPCGPGSRRRSGNPFPHGNRGDRGAAHLPFSHPDCGPGGLRCGRRFSGENSEEKRERWKGRFAKRGKARIIIRIPAGDGLVKSPSATLHFNFVVAAYLDQRCQALNYEFT